MLDKSPMVIKLLLTIIHTKRLIHFVTFPKVLKAFLYIKRHWFRKARTNWLVRWCEITTSQSEHRKMVEIEIQGRVQGYVERYEKIWRRWSRANKQKRLSSRAWTIWPSFTVGGAIDLKIWPEIYSDDHALNSMLSRCGVLEPGPVNYVKLLERFQDRSDQGESYFLYQKSVDGQFIRLVPCPGRPQTMEV